MVRRLIAAGLVAACGVAGAAGDEDSTFLDGQALAQRLVHNLVYIRAEGIAEHGFGFVVGADADALWVATARHVIAPEGGPGPAASGIRVRPCALPAGTAIDAQPWAGFDAGGFDIALLRVPRPAGYQPLTRALAPELPPVGESVWLLGGNDECAPMPAVGRFRAGDPGRTRVRVDIDATQGGSSGGALLTGRGLIALLQKADDLTTISHDIADIQRRVQAAAGANWLLEDARNWPPGDWRSAEIDLTETLRQYQMALRNVHGLLQMTTVARPTVDDYLKRYNAAADRFSRIRDSHNGTLQQRWGATALQRWQSLAKRLWDVHLNFWRVNPQMEEIYRSQRTTESVRGQMLALAPQIEALENDLEQFVRLLAKEPSP